MAAGTPPVRQATFLYGDECGRGPIAPRDGVEALYAPRRNVLDSAAGRCRAGRRRGHRHGLALVELARSETGRVTGVVLEDEGGAA